MTHESEQLAEAWAAFCRGEDVSGELAVARQALGTSASRAMAVTLLLSSYLSTRAWAEAGALLDATDPAVRVQAAKELKAQLDLRPGIELAPLLPIFVELLGRDGDPAIVAESAARAVARIAAGGVDVQAALPVLRAAMGRSGEIVRRALKEVLARQPEGNLGALLATIAEELFVADRAVREKAARGLEGAADSGYGIAAVAADRLRELRLTADRNPAGLPEFLDPIALDGARAWSARLDHWDRRLSDVCYLVTSYQQGRERRRFFVQLPDYVARDASELRRQLQELARAEQPNTAYAGSPSDRASGLYRDVAPWRAPESRRRA